MDQTDHYRMFAAYNRWANGQLYDVVAGLNEEEWNRDVGAFFKSICGTLNHLLVGDRIWMHRFTGTGETSAGLNDVPFPQFADLRAAREAMDARIVDWIETLDVAALSGEFSYTPITNPQPMKHRLAPAVAHLFNHQTHHRGQAHSVLSLLGHAPPPLDLIYFLRSEEGAAFM
ncbi:DinB family protein [Oricola sp.]|uniref:DinB family protein n=1 Tax=Oricola sp. TaxID=1979950 RepID=UPI003BAC285D